MPKSKKFGLRTVVTFTSSSFLTADMEGKPRFRGTYGDDVAIWLMLEMGLDGIDIVPGLNQSDDGWFYVFRIGGRRYIAWIKLYDQSRLLWQVALECDASGPAAWFGGRRRGVRPPVAQALHTVLLRSDKATNISWYVERDIRAGNEGKGSPGPMATTG